MNQNFFSGLSYNPRKAELYLRKALFIRQKEKELSVDLTSKKSTNSVNVPSARDNPTLSERSMDTWSEKTLPQTNGGERMLANEEQNNIAEILYDLGSLLGTFDSSIARREAVDCVQRSLDIKALILGPSHPDCIIIKQKLNEIIFENAQLNAYLSSKASLNKGNVRRENYLMSRPSSTNKTYSESAPKVKLVKCLRELKRQIGVDPDSVNTQLDLWIKKNSIIEKIPTRFNRTIYEPKSPALERSYEQEEESLTESADHSNQIEIQQTDSTPASLIMTPNIHKNKFKIKKLDNISSEKSSENTVITKLSLTRSVPQLPTKSEKSYHLKSCKCPTALSIDVHNAKSVNGPNSSIRTILSVDPVIRSTPREKTYKHIYYKSAWYDLPIGSCTKRYKNFIKVAPNA